MHQLVGRVNWLEGDATIVLLRYTLAGAAQAVVRREHSTQGARRAHRRSDKRCARGPQMGCR